MVKILLVMPYFYPHKGGSQKYAEELYTTLLTQYPNQYQVDVVCYNTTLAPQFEKYRNLNIYRLPCIQLIPDRFALANPFSLIQLLIKLSKNHYDFVNSQLIFFDPCWWLWLYGRLIQAKSIFTEHVASFPVHQNKLVEIISHLTDKTIGRFSVNRYDIITTTNRSAIEFLKTKIGINRPVNLIYGGVNTTYFSPSKTNLKVKLIPNINHQLKSSDVLITFVGRLIWTKGVTLLYDSIKNIINQIPTNVYFVLAGGGELEKDLSTKIANDHLQNRVFLTGFIPYQFVRDLLQITDIFVTPSFHNEGFPNTVLEAGSCQNFIIATDNAGTKEVISRQKTGYLIPQKDQASLEKALIWAIRHPQSRKRIAQTMRQLMVSKFDWTKIASDFHQLIQNNQLSIAK